MSRNQPTSVTADTAICLPLALNAERWTTIANVLRLTPRQSDIVYLLLQAKKDKEIAIELGLGVTTVRMHLRHVFRELHVADRLELVLLIFNIVCRDNNHTPLPQQ